MFRWTVVPLALRVGHLCVHLGAHATTLASMPLSQTPHDYSYDASWLKGYSYFFSNDPSCFQIKGKPEYIGDGDCDLDNNNEECDYDGGDCCVCTCLDAEYACGDGRYHCLDPDVSDDCRKESDSDDFYTPRYDENDFLACAGVGGDTGSVGDGRCDIYNSNEECNYDRGDCCSCTCEDGEEHVCGSNGGYYCMDPSVPSKCKEVSDSYIPLLSSASGYEYSKFPGCSEAEGSPLSIGDAYCDNNNNIEECDYDGGDCCICTCEDDGEMTCGDFPGYFCQDPSVSQECRQASLTSFESSYTAIFNEYPGCLDGNTMPFVIGDGFCDIDANVEECGYDGGDCCSCTCKDTGDRTCGEWGFYCWDPNVPAECVEESRMIYPSSFESWDAFDQYYLCEEAHGNWRSVGDGKCNPYNNIEECGYDGGDCCMCTCVETEWVTCGEYGGYWCRDPSVPVACVEASAAYVPPYSSSAFVGYIEHPECYGAGGDPQDIGNGDCDFRNSVEECGYDGGDCCVCTCVDTEFNSCGEDGGYYCRDPRVSEACKEESDSYVALVSSTYLYRFSQYRGCYEVGGYGRRIGDGLCDSQNNNEECAYDGGDCCSCTCVDGEIYKCGDFTYDCRDPTVRPECAQESAAQNPGSFT